MGNRILVVEDNIINIAVIKSLLHEKGYFVNIEMNGKKGFENFKNSAPGYYSAVIMDIFMPEMNGLEAARKIRRLSREDAKAVPIIALTTNAEEEDRRKSIEAGMNYHMVKPVCAEELYTILTDLL